MADFSEIVRLAIDTYHGRPQKYSVDESLETLRKALVDLNGGSTVIDYKAIRDGKCNGLFTLVEEILARTIVEGLQGDEYFNQLVEFRNVAAGDKPIFEIEDSTLFVVDDVAEGTQGLRRQRIGGYEQKEIPTVFKAVRIYEEMNRILAGRADFNQLIDKVSKSFQQKLLNDIYALWASATQTDFGGAVYFPAAGDYDEDVLLEIVEHVEAASGGKQATIIGTKKGARKLAPSVQGADSKSDLYNKGYYGSFYGSPVIAVPQRHQIGTTNFVLDDNVLSIIAGDQKPIKCVYEGQSIITNRNPEDNRDFTQEYFYGEKYGLGLVMAGGNSGLGRYDMTPTTTGG